MGDYSEKIDHFTETGLKQGFRVGLQTLNGTARTTGADKNNWPQILQQVYDEQTKIGWNYVLFGRLSRK